MSWSFAEAATVAVGKLKGFTMVTCAAPACIEWAKLRAVDLRGGPHLMRQTIDVARWRYCPEVPSELGGNGRRDGAGNIWDEREQIDKYRDKAAI